MIFREVQQAEYVKSRGYIFFMGKSVCNGHCFFMFAARFTMIYLTSIVCNYCFLSIVDECGRCIQESFDATSEPAGQSVRQWYC